MKTYLELKKVVLHLVKEQLLHNIEFTTIDICNILKEKYKTNKTNLRIDSYVIASFIRQTKLVKSNKRLRWIRIENAN